MYPKVYCNQIQIQIPGLDNEGKRGVLRCPGAAEWLGFVRTIANYVISRVLLH